MCIFFSRFGVAAFNSLNPDPKLGLDGLVLHFLGRLFPEGQGLGFRVLVVYEFRQGFGSNVAGTNLPHVASEAEQDHRRVFFPVL